MKLESNWLVSSHTVAGIQNYFGLERINEDPPTSQTNGVQHSDSANTNGVHHRQPASEHNTVPQTESTPKETTRYKVNNKFWFYLFGFGASLGDDIFYYTFYPFWFYNLSPWVIRRVILMWGLIMYVGQSSKEILRWPRPSEPPAVRIEKRYNKEYGMPSTHAMVGTLVPFTILAVTWDHYEYSHTLGVILATSYSLLVCFSRLYRGMHYILDVIVGVVITFVMLAVMLPLVDHVDFFLLTNPVAPFVFIAASLMALAYHPCEERWNDARADTTVIWGVVNGVFVGSWLQNQFGEIADVHAPFPIEWPNGMMDIVLMFVREFIGLSVMITTHLTVRPLMVWVLSAILRRRIDRNNNNNPKETVVEFPYKYVSYLCVGVSALFAAKLFPLVGL